MPRCACDTDAKRPRTKHATQRVLARSHNTLIASKLRGMIPSAGRRHLPTSGRAAQEQCQLPHAIAMASHTARGLSRPRAQVKVQCSRASSASMRELMAAHYGHDKQAPAAVMAHQAAWQPGAGLAPLQPMLPPWTDGLSTSPPTAVKRP